MQRWILKVFFFIFYSAAAASKVKSRGVHTLNLTLPFSKDKQAKVKRHKNTNKQTKCQANCQTSNIKGKGFEARARACVSQVWLGGRAPLAAGYSSLPESKPRPSRS